MRVSTAARRVAIETTPPEADLVTDLGKGEHLVKRELPLGHRTLHEGEDQPVDDVRRGLLSGGDRAHEVCASLLCTGKRCPVARAGQLDGGRREAIRRGGAGSGPEPWVHPPNPEAAWLPEEDDRNRCG